jgi:asparagine synthase (glutamine-hydrolysing)
MCGIAALLLTRLDHREALEFVSASLSAISHRGEPRFQSECWSGRLGAAGANRLAFTSGLVPQPARDEAGRYRVFLNGEIYSLHDPGTGLSDTQRLTDRIAERGVVDALRPLEGMYAVLAIDLLEGCFYLARDPFGIKPLYYSRTGHGILVGSELKALLRHPFVEEIRHVEAGSVLRFDARSVNDVARIGLAADERGRSADEMADDLRSALSKSVRDQTRDGQTYGIYLSGGLDSSAVYALARTHGASIRPLVLGTAAASDVAAAKEVTSYFGDELITVDCPSESQLFSEISETIRICESFEPNVVRQSAVSRVLARAAKEHGCRVALCGEGADELFGGYPEFWDKGIDYASTRASFLRDLPRTQLQRVDRCNMSQTIEVRVPFLCRQVAGLALAESDPRRFGNLDGTFAKRPLRDAMRSILPASIVKRRKVVLSEGAGLRGNNYATGMFSDFFVTDHLGTTDAVSVGERNAWKLQNNEEEYYFRIFRAYGYDKYADARNRVTANSTATLELIGP